MPPLPGVLDVVEAQAPEPAVVRFTRGGHEVEVVAPLLARIPGSVFAPLQACDSARDRGRLQPRRIERGDVAQVEEVEAALADVAGGGVPEPEHVALLGDGLAVDRDRDPEEGAVDEAGLFHGMAVAHLAADVDVHLAGEPSPVRRGAEAAVVGQDRPSSSPGDTERPPRSRRPCGPCAGAARLHRRRGRYHPRPGAALGDFLAAHVDAFARALAIVESAFVRKVGGAEPLPLRRARDVFAADGIPQEHFGGRRREVPALVDAQRLGVDGPPRDEGAVAAVRAHDAGGAGGDLVVHEKRELAVPGAEGPEPVRDPDHPVALDGIADGQDGLRPGTRDAGQEVRLGAGAGTDVGALGAGFSVRQCGRTDEEKRCCERSFEERPTSAWLIRIHCGSLISR